MTKRKPLKCLDIHSRYCCSLFVSIIADYREHSINELTNDSSAAILQMVPMVYRKFLTMKPRNQTAFNNKNSSTNDGQRGFSTHSASVDEMLRNIARYNELQSVLNEDLFGPLQNDSVIIVVQVSVKYEKKKSNRFSIEEKFSWK